MVTSEGEARPSTTAEEESTARGKQLGSTVAYIPRYVPQRREGYQTIRLGKNTNYTINMQVTPKGVHVTSDIVSKL